MEHSSIRLSILICHLNDRDASLLITKLKLQAKKKPVEVLINSDDGELTIGTKRNELIRSAKGDYICFVDDDDDVSDDYVLSILKSITGNPDVVGIEGVVCYDNKKSNFYHSIEYQGWYTGSDGFYRTPNHLNPVKRSLALSVMFPEIDFGEDKKYSERLIKQVKTENYIDKPIYFYKIKKR